MSDRRLLLDGPDLQRLLTRAAEVGGTVVRAERTRKGLLARAWYEVTVTVPTLPGPPTPPAPAPVPLRPRPVTHPPARQPAGISDLLAAADAAERMDAAASRGARSASTRSAKRDSGR